MDLGEAAQPMHEPLRRKIRRGADGERAAALALQQPLGSVGDSIEGIAHDREVGATCLGDHQSLPFAIEQLQPELGLERLHLMADGALGDAELLGGAREALVTGRGFEGLERIERRQPAWHRRTKAKRKLRQAREKMVGLQCGPTTCGLAAIAPATRSRYIGADKAEESRQLPIG